MKEIELSVMQKLFYFFPVLFCFCLPFGSLVLSGLIVLWIITSFFNIDKKYIQQGLKNRKPLLFYLFFFLTLISAFFFSENKEEAAFSVEVKLTFFFFPYLFFCFKWPVEILKRCVISFVSGCFFASLCLIIRAAFYALGGQPEYFFYTLFSGFIHVSYFAMYLVLAGVFVLVFYKDWYGNQKNALYSSYFFVFVFVTTIFLCSSKLGLISLFISMPMVVVYRYRKSLNPKRVMLIIIGLLILAGLSAKLFPGSFKRFNSISAVSLEKIDKTSVESTTVRILIWKEALILIQKNFIAGTGVGDANDALKEAYRQNGLTGAYEHHFNAHNQFFQTFIGMGVIGFCLLLLITFGTMIMALKQKQFVLFVFSLLICLNFMVESMLQTSAGVLFFVFFSCLFARITEQELKKNISAGEVWV